MTIGHILDEDVGDVVAELASGERVDVGACLSWSCCESWKANSGYVAVGGMAACIVRGEVECPMIPIPVPAVSIGPCFVDI